MPTDPPPSRDSARRPQVIAIANQKGGVGKTTTAVNLGTALAAVGRRVLIVDLDPQGNASTSLGVASAARRVGSYELMTGEAELPDAVLETEVPGLFVVPSTMTLSGAEIELVEASRREFRLADALDRAAAAALMQPYDYVLIDCPPSLSLLTVNALTAAGSVLVPLQAEFLALEGLSHLLRTIERVRRRLNPALAIHGIVLTMVDRRNKLSEAVAADVRRHLGDCVYATEIPRNVRISEAPSHGKPALLYDLRSTGAQAYVRLAGEFLRRAERPGTAPVAAGVVS